MKRYFDAPDDKMVIEFDIEDGSEAATAPVDSFKKVFKMNMREINKEEYLKLKKKYTK